MTYNNHLKLGSTNPIHRDRRIATSLNSMEFEEFLKSMDSFEFDVGYVPPGFEHRADLISNLFYNTPTLDWVILWFNNIKDPLQELNIRDRIKIPKLV